jgi:hypothetical protein
MRTFTLSALFLVIGGASAFSSQSLATSRSTGVAVNMGYVPDGFTADTYKKFKAEENKKKQSKNLGGVGPRGFESRSMQSFQEAMERGEASHLMPVFNAKERIKKGTLRKEDVPYMQRGGKWDNTDIKGAKNKKKWLSSDKDYASGGFRKEQSVSILGYGEGLDWTGRKGRSGPEGVMAAAPKFGRNYKAPNVKNMKKVVGKAKDEQPKKKGGLFGMF